MRAALWLLVGNNVTRTAPRVLLTTGWNISRKGEVSPGFLDLLGDKISYFLSYCNSKIITTIIIIINIVTS